MGIYTRLIFPWLCDWTMRNPRIDRLRMQTLAQVEGETAANTLCEFGDRCSG